MNMNKDDNFDYQAYTKMNPPDVSKIQRGPEARQQRLETALMKFAVRIDEDILAQFQQLAPDGEKCERVINQALREWLSVKGVKELVRTEFQQMLQRALVSVQVGAEQAKLEKPLAVQES